MSSVKPYVFPEAEELITPQLVYYQDIIQANLVRLMETAGGPERLWPHVKSHKMLRLVQLQMEKGIDRFKCATIAEAEMVAMAGAGDALLAYPLVGPNIRRFLSLEEAYPSTRFWAVGEDARAVGALAAAADARGRTVRLLVDVDMGMHRTGVPLTELERLYREWSELPGLRLKGFHCYDGNRHETEYSVRSREVESCDQTVLAIRDRLLQQGYACDVLVMGGTPSFPCHAKCTRHYLSPGTGLVQDKGYRDSFPDLPFQPGGILLTRVVSRPGRDLFTCDLGYKAVAADPGGERAEIIGMEYAETVFQNEEHWVLRVPEKHRKDLPAVGELLYCIPTHICPTSALYPTVPVVSGGRLAEWWEVTARNRKLTI